MGGSKEVRPWSNLPQLQDLPQNPGGRLLWVPSSPLSRDGCLDVALGGSVGCSQRSMGPSLPQVDCQCSGAKAFTSFGCRGPAWGQPLLPKGSWGPAWGDLISLTALLFAGLGGAINLPQRWQVTLRALRSVSLCGQLLQAGVLLPALAQGLQT